jgi:hypothetical protein
MLRVTDEGRKIEIRFDHKVLESDVIEGMSGICIDGERRCTVATLILNGQINGQGISICHSKDNFNKAMGRKRALSEVLYQLSKKTRTSIWKEYHKQCGV